jgi:N-acetylglucosaminyldiphosphoundecaprenol N-acetyl-beta-D-mannosaminyltransferase
MASMIEAVAVDGQHLRAAPVVAARELSRRYPGVKIAETHAGSPRASDFPEIRARLQAAQPDVLLVAYGAPTQDLWIEGHRRNLPASIRVAMGVGGVFDYLSGRVPLAPVLMRRLGLEWLYRLANQPWRWRRILRVFHFATLAIVETFKRNDK